MSCQLVHCLIVREVGVFSRINLHGWPSLPARCRVGCTLRRQLFQQLKHSV
jgi:hypothetical protein